MHQGEAAAQTVARHAAAQSSAGDASETLEDEEQASSSSDSVPFHARAASSDRLSFEDSDAESETSQQQREQQQQRVVCGCGALSPRLSAATWLERLFERGAPSWIREECEKFADAETLAIQLCVVVRDERAPPLGLYTDIASAPFF